MSQSIVTAGQASDASSPWKAFYDFLIRRRIVLSSVLFVGLVAEDVLWGPVPHDLLDYRNPFSVLGAALVVGGLALRSWAAGILRKDRELTTTGPYSFLRNPLYLGSFLMMFGFCVLIGELANFFFIAGPVILIYTFKVRSEEHSLARQFPTQWSEYSQRTRRFVPKLSGEARSGDWSARQWMASREYQALGTTLAGLALIKVWHAFLQ